MLISDWARVNHSGRFAFHGGPAYDLSSIGTKVLAISVTGDSDAPPSSVDHLCKDLPNVTRRHYDNGLDHLRWVKEAGPIAERIAQMS